MAVPRTLALFPPDAALPAPRKREREIPVEHPRKRSLPPLALALRQPPGSEPRALPKTGQLWLAIHLPRLSLDCLTRDPANAGTSEEPLAVVDADDRVQTVLACNSIARAAGVRAGQPLNAALALESRLETLPRDIAGEQALLEKIAAWCHRFTPIVSLEVPDELLLEVKGSLHLFGGARSLMELVAEGLRTRGIDAALALTPTPRSALWLARSRTSAASAEGSFVDRTEDLVRLLQPLPLRFLRLPVEKLQLLASMGVSTTGDLLRLPRMGLARRLGPHWLLELDQAVGRHAEARRRFRTPERFDERISLDCEIEATDRLLLATEPALQRLQRFLRVREAAIAALMLQLDHRTGPATRVRLGLAAPTSDIGHVHSLLSERLSKIDLQAPVVSIRLRSSALLASISANANLPCAPARHAGEPRALSSSPNADALPRLIERLQARLGRAGVFGISVLDDHRPERAWRAIEFKTSNSKETRVNGNDTQATRPLWLLPDPQPIPDLRGGASNGWRVESGPERIESGWWDGSDLMRDYFVARNPRGIRSWVFRERRAPHRWYLHGLFG